MKVIVCALIVCVISHFAILADAEPEELLDEEEQVCAIETDYPTEEVMEAKKTNTIPPNDKKYEDFLSCCWKKYGYQHAGGKMNWEKIREILEKSYKPVVAKSLAEKCHHVQGDSDGNMVVHVLICLDEHAPNLRAVHGYYAGHHGG